MIFSSIRGLNDLACGASSVRKRICPFGRTELPTPDIKAETGAGRGALQQFRKIQGGAQISALSFLMMSVGAAGGANST